MKIRKIFILLLIITIILPYILINPSYSYYNETDFKLLENYLYNIIYSNDNYDFRVNNSLLFYDEYTDSYRIFSTSDSKNSISFGGFNDYPLYDTYLWIGRCTLRLYTIHSDGSYEKETYTEGSSNRSCSVNTIFNYNCFSPYNVMYGYSQEQSGHIYDFITALNSSEYVKKSVISKPCIYTNNNQINIDGKLVIGSGSTRIGENNYIPFSLEFWNDTPEIQYSIVLDNNSPYFNSENGKYYIPIEDLNYYLTNGKNYILYINLFTDNHFYYKSEEIELTWGNFTIAGTPEGGDNENEDTSTNQIVGSIGNMSNQITSGLNEVNETNKGMWESIKEVLSYINPFSENFFVYKLIELLLDMLKSLFIPSEDFFTNWLDDLNSYFGDTFGILYFPMELFIDFLNRIDTIDSTNPIINVPEFKLEFMGYSATFIKSFSYDFNSLLVNNTFKTIHTIYLSIVDVILWLTVVYTASKCIKNILGGMSDEILDNATSSERSYKQYEKYMNNKKRYKNEHRE